MESSVIAAESKAKNIVLDQYCRIHVVHIPTRVSRGFKKNAELFSSFPDIDCWISREILSQRTTIQSESWVKALALIISKCRSIQGALEGGG
jgi:hypothetical protein